jgi:hypothetical protein
MPADPAAELARLAIERNQLEVHLRELRTGTGRHEHSDAGHAARQLADARRNLERAEREARSPELSRRQRRKAEAVVEDHREEFDTATQDWRECGHEFEQELLSAVDYIDGEVSSLETRRHQHAFWQLEHPAASRRLQALRRQIHALEHQAGISAPEPPQRPAPVLGGLSR